MDTSKKGFTLLETLVVIVLIGVIAAASFAAMRRSQTAAAADTFIELQAREMSQFAAAAQAYANEQKASWVVSQRYEITAAQLVTAGKLPTTFAVRGGTTGASPIGELYRAFAIKDASNVARLVIADFGRAPTDALVRRAGYQVNATSLQGYKARVADAIAKATKGFSAYVPAGTMTARGPAGTFTQVLNAYFGNVAPTMPVVIELVGWPEYVIPGSQPPGGSGGNFTCTTYFAEPLQGTPPRLGDGYCKDAWGSVRGCSSHDPNGSAGTNLTYVPPSCPSGRPPTARIPICEGGSSTVLSIRTGYTLAYGMGSDSSNREETWSPGCSARFGAEPPELRTEKLRTSRELQSLVSNGIPSPPVVCAQRIEYRQDAPLQNNCTVYTADVPHPVKTGVWRISAGQTRLLQIPGGTPEQRTHIACCEDL